MKRQPLIGEIVAFLEQQNPESIEKIRNDFPSYSLILKKGEVLGNSTDNEELRARAIVCSKATETVIHKVDLRIPNIKNKIKNTYRIQLWGQILSSVSGASILITLGKVYISITYVLGGLSLVSALVPLIVDFQRKTIDKNKHLDETYVELIQLRLEAEQNSQQLKFFVEHDFNINGITEIILKCNKLCSDIMEKDLLI